MPINGFVHLQRRSAQIGEIRIGTSVAIPGKNGRKPVRLETFRFTTASEHAANVIAAKYGGEVAPWAQRKGKWEVTTDRKALEVWVPPRGEAVDANMELWDGPRRLRKCDGITEQMSGKPCWCPRDRDELKRLTALRPPQACKPLTHINVTIPDLPGLTGVWRLNTGSENAAVETADSGDAMAIAREGGVYLPGVLLITWRNRVGDGSLYPVPFLQIGMSMQELAQGQLPAGPSGLLTQLRGEQRAAITGGPANPPAAELPSAAADDEPLPEFSDAVIPADYAQKLAYAAMRATTRTRVKTIGELAKKTGVDGEMVCTDDENDEWEELRPFLLNRYAALPEEAAA